VFVTRARRPEYAPTATDAALYQTYCADARRRGINGPVLHTWIENLLADRRERLQQLAHARQRLEQAYRYLDKLLGACEPIPDIRREEGKEVRRQRNR
jgi:hypothetical protein